MYEIGATIAFYPPDGLGVPQIARIMGHVYGLLLIDHDRYRAIKAERVITGIGPKEEKRSAKDDLHNVYQ